MKKKALKTYDAQLTANIHGVTAYCKCWVCGKVTMVVYTRDSYGRLVRTAADLCPHVIGWDHAIDFSWLKMSFKQPPRPRRKKAAK